MKLSIVYITACVILAIAFILSVYSLGLDFFNSTKLSLSVIVYVSSIIIYTRNNEWGVFVLWVFLFLCLFSVLSIYEEEISYSFSIHISKSKLAIIPSLNVIVSPVFILYTLFYYKVIRQKISFLLDFLV